MWVEVRTAYRITVKRKKKKTKWKKLLSRPRYGWEDNVKMNLTEIWNGNVDWIQLVQDKLQWWALLNTVIILQLP
jgi:hypothetical protein